MESERITITEKKEERGEETEEEWDGDREGKVGDNEMEIEVRKGANEEWGGR